MTSTMAIEASVAADEAEGQLASLVSAARAGDRVALEALLETIERRVYTFAYRLVGNRAAAEDVSQEVFLKVCRRLDQYRGGTNFMRWVYRIVVNQTHDYRRAAGPTTAEFPELLPPQVTTPAAQSNSGELRKRCRCSVRKSGRRWCWSRSKASPAVRRLVSWVAWR